MPRCKFDRTKKFAYQILITSKSKEMHEDIIHDLKIIYPKQIKRFSNWLPCNDSVYEHFSLIKELNAETTLKYRAYIVSSVDMINLIMMPIDESVFKNLQDKYEFISESTPKWVSPDYISTLFLFSGKRLLGGYDITANQLATLMAVFKKENLVDFSGARDDYYAKPRREYKKL